MSAARLPTPEEARQSLAEIDAVALRTRRCILSGLIAPHLVLWGIIWMAGFLVTQFWPSKSGVAWAILDGFGVPASIVIGWRSPPLRSPDLAKIGGFLAALIVFAAVWAILLWPFDPGRIGPYICSVAMFAYVVGGLWYGRELIWLGTIVTGLILAGVLLLPGWMNLWIGVVGGGSLLGSGVYLRSGWR